MTEPTDVTASALQGAIDENRWHLLRQVAEWGNQPGVNGESLAIEPVGISVDGDSLWVSQVAKGGALGQTILTNSMRVKR